MEIKMKEEIKLTRAEEDVISLTWILAEGLRFQKQTYPTIKNTLNQIFDYPGETENYWANYQLSKFKQKKKEFASWFVNMDDRFWSALLEDFGIELKYPEIEITDEVKKHLPHHDLRERRNLQININKIHGASDWDLYPREYLLLKKFCVYSLNHSSLKDFENNEFPKPKNALIDFKGWASYFNTRLSEDKRVVFINFLLNY